MNPSQRPITGAILQKLSAAQERMRVGDQINSPPPSVVDQLSACYEEEPTDSSNEVRPYEPGSRVPPSGEVARFRGRKVVRPSPPYPPPPPVEYAVSHQDLTSTLEEDRSPVRRGPGRVLIAMGDLLPAPPRTPPPLPQTPE